MRKKTMTPEQMKKIRLAAGFKKADDLGAEVDRSRRWVQNRESGKEPIDRLEVHALENIKRTLVDKKKKK